MCTTVCKTNVELHNGSVSLRSEEGGGRGSVFTIALPAGVPLYESSPSLPVDPPTKLWPAKPRRPSLYKSKKWVVPGEELAHLSNSNQYDLPTPLKDVERVFSFYNTSQYSRSNIVSREKSSSKISGRFKNCLIVDDVQMNRKMLRRALEKRAINIEEANDGNEAVAKVQLALRSNSTIDVIFMDYQMPEMDGPTATKKIRDLGYKGLVLGVTGNALEKDINHFISQGADRVLLKPVDIATLEAAIGIIHDDDDDMKSDP